MTDYKELANQYKKLYAESCRKYGKAFCNAYSVDRDGIKAKAPVYFPNGLPIKCSWTDQTNLMTFDQAVDNIANGKADRICLILNFAMHDGKHAFCIDKDHYKQVVNGDGDIIATVAGEWTNEVLQDVATMATHTTISNRGDGLHILGECDVDKLPKDKGVWSYDESIVTVDGKKTTQKTEYFFYDKYVMLTAEPLYNDRLQDVEYTNDVFILLAESEQRKQAEQPAKQETKTQASKNYTGKGVDLCELLKYIDPAGLMYEDWLKIGMALNYEGYSFDAWDAWSQSDVDRYDAKEMPGKWASFKGNPNPVTGAFITMWAKYGGWKSKAEQWQEDVKEMLAQGWGDKGDEVATDTTPDDETRPHFQWPYVSMAKNPKPLKEEKGNFLYLLNYFNTVLSRNDLTQEIHIYANGKEIKKAFEDFVIDVRGRAARLGLHANMGDVKSALTALANKKKFNPLQEYYIQCFEQWDGKSDHVSNLFALFTIDPKHAEYMQLFKNELRYWLRACVMLAFNDGTKAAQGALVLQGPKGVGKSRFCAKLLPADLIATDESMNPANKDDVIRTTHYGICEVAEAASSMKQVNEWKKFITARSDEYRVPFDPAPIRHPRHTNFMMTINDPRFLMDETGNRKFWIIPVIKIDVDKLTSAAMVQVWAQVYNEYFNGDAMARRWWLDAGEQKQLDEMGKPFELRNDVQQIIIDKLNWESDRAAWKEVTASELCESLGLPIDRNSSKMGKALRKLVDENEIELAYDGKGKHASKFIVPPVIHKDEYMNIDEHGAITYSDNPNLMKWQS